MKSARMLQITSFIFFILFNCKSFPYQTYAKLDYLIKPINGVHAEFEEIVSRNIKESLNYYRLGPFSNEISIVENVQFNNKNLVKITSCIPKLESFPKEEPILNYAFREYSGKIENLKNIEVYFREVIILSFPAGTFSHCFVLIGEEIAK